MELLNGHTNEENGLIIENYPYGFRLRTNIKYWIETNKNKGDRFVSQTLNPKTNEWNKPKKSIYNAVMVMIRKDNGHISYLGLYPTTNKKDIKGFLERTKDFDFSKEQINQLNILKAYSKVYENVTFKCEVKKFRHKETGLIVESVPLMEINLYEEVGNEEGQKDKEQQKATELINKCINIEYNKLNRGLENGTNT